MGYIYDLKGKLLTSIHGEANREVIPLDKISPNLKRAVLASEDGHFYYHHGINPTGVGRAVVVNLVAGGVKEGGSTITMQLVKNLFLSQKRAFTRKIAEGVLAMTKSWKCTSIKFIGVIITMVCKQQHAVTLTSHRNF